MGWTYLAALEGSASLSETGLDPSPTVKSTTTVKEFSYQEWRQATSPHPQFGTMCDPFQLKVFPQESTLSPEAFPARISALQDAEKAWKESEADYFSRSCAWPKKSSPSSYFWRTSPLLHPEEAVPSLEKLPRWGMIVDGVLYPLLPLEPCTDENAGSYWLTPSTMEHLPVRTGKALDYVMRRGGTSYRKTPGRLNEQVAYPSMWPLVATPTASQAGKPIRSPSPSRTEGKHGEDLQDSIGRLDTSAIGKKLSVEFVELLMGYLTKWTDLSPSVMQWYLSKSKRRSKS